MASFSDLNKSREDWMRKHKDADAIIYDSNVDEALEAVYWSPWKKAKMTLHARCRHDWLPRRTDKLCLKCGAPEK